MEAKTHTQPNVVNEYIAIHMGKEMDKLVVLDAQRKDRQYAYISSSASSSFSSLHFSSSSRQPSVPSHW